MTLLVTHKPLTLFGVFPELGKKIGEIREDFPLTQIEAAIKAGVSHSIIQKLEAGNPVSRKTFVKIAEAIGLTGTPEFADLILVKANRRGKAKLSAGSFAQTTIDAAIDALAATGKFSPEDIARIRQQVVSDGTEKPGATMEGFNHAEAFKRQPVPKMGGVSTGDTMAQAAHVNPDAERAKRAKGQPKK